MNKRELKKYLKDRNLKATKSAWSDVVIYSKELDYVKGVKGLGISVLYYEDDLELNVLMPETVLTESEITFLTTHRKNNLWTDSYSNSYSTFKKYELSKLTAEKLDSILDQQKRQYNVLNNLHKEAEFKPVLDRMKIINDEIKDRKNTLSQLKSKICTLYERKMMIEED